MKPHPLCFIVNPAAPRCPRDIADRIRRRFPAATIELSAAPGHASALAAEAVEDRGSEGILLVACGGDGTLREVAQSSDSGTRLGILPLGTVNLVARYLGIPEGLEQSMDVLERGAPTPVYPGICRRDGEEHGDLFFIGVSAGPDADAVCAVGPSLKLKLGRYAYALRFLVRMLGPIRSEVVYGDSTDSGRCSQLIALRMPFYGGAYRMSTRCSLGQRTFELITVEGGRLAVAQLFWSAYRSRVVPLGGVTRRSSTGVTLTLPPVNGCYQMDGDGFRARTLTLSIGEEPLHLVAPETSRR